MNKPRQRAVHKKSRAGCARCKHHRKSCDEQKPACSRCRNLGVDCRWPVANSKTLFRKIIIVDPSKSIKVTVPQVEKDAYEHFHHRSIPLLDECQPLLQWCLRLGFGVHVNTPLRKIVAAFALQQRSLDESKQTRMYALIAYQQALSTWRQVVTNSNDTDAPIMALGCILLVMLESMRDEKAAVITHLRQAMKILNEAPAEHYLDLLSLATLAQAYCTNVWLYSLAPYRKSSSKLHDDHKLVDGSGKKTSDLHDLQLRAELRDALSKEQNWTFELHDLILQHLKARRLLSLTNGSDEGRVCIEALLRPMLGRACAARASIDELSIAEATPALLCLQAYFVLMTSLLGQTATTAMQGAVLEIHPLDAVTNLIGQALQQMSSSRRYRNPFGVANGMVQMLEFVIMHGISEELRHRAWSLLGKCPLYEGLYDAEEVANAVEPYILRREKFAHDLTDPFDELSVKYSASNTSQMRS